MTKIIPQYKLYDYKIERNDMNKYKEALDNVIDMICNGKGYWTAKESIETLQELIDKETPIKPTLLNTERGQGYFCKCDNCVGLISNDKQDEKYCYNCGQALDWSENNE